MVSLSLSLDISTNIYQFHGGSDHLAASLAESSAYGLRGVALQQLDLSQSSAHTGR
jgi:hypothetical protein